MFKAAYFIVTTIGVVSLAFYLTDKGDPTVFPFPAEQARTMLSVAKTALPRKDGPGEINIWSTGLSEKGIRLTMQYASWASKLRCEAVITSVGTNKSRVVPDCGESPNRDLASVRMNDESRVPMFEEHIQSTLHKRAFDRTIADRKIASSVIRNIGGLQDEIRKSAEEAAKVQLGTRY